jgi:Ig domain of plant-specific actin-binding protein
MFPNYAMQAGRNPTYRDDNGKKTTWINPVNKTEALTGNNYQASAALHPNYWGQRALSSCIARAISAKPASEIWTCEKDPARDLDAEGRPSMKLVTMTPLWMTVTGKPIITGRPNVGQVLTADATGDFSDSKATLAYQWLRDGTPITGATAKTYTVVAGDIGKALSVKVTATSGSESANATSATVTVTGYLAVTPPAITGTPKVGETLTATPGTYSAAPDSVTYQWKADGADLAGKTSSTLVLTPDLVGERISVTVTATKAPNAPLTQRVAEVGPVAKADMSVTGKPTISGNAITGSTLKADIGSVVFTPAVTKNTWEWYRDGTPVRGVNGPAYTLGAADVGKKITVAAEAEPIGYNAKLSAQSDAAQSVVTAPTATPSTTPSTSPSPSPSTSASPTASPSATPSTSPSKVVSNVVKKATNKVVGKPVLQYVTPWWGTFPLPQGLARYNQPMSPSITKVFSTGPGAPKYVWEVATSSSGKGAKVRSIPNPMVFKPLASDIGKYVRAKVTAVNPAMTNNPTATTKWVKVVKAIRYGSLPPELNALSAKVGKKITSSAAKFSPNPKKITYQWYKNKTRSSKPVKIAGATKLSYTPKKSDAGYLIWIKASTKATKLHTARSDVSLPVTVKK